jgi:hypothetical protein
MSSDETAADVDAPEVEMETVGVDEMVRQERVRSIFQSKRDCREARTKASNEVAIGDADAGAIIYRNALETYIREVEPLFSQTKKGRRYWSEYDFGELVEHVAGHDEQGAAEIDPFDEAEDRTVLTDDLLEEVDEWRGENIRQEDEP